MRFLTQVSSWLLPTARAALALLAFALPFELVAPLGHVGPLQLTSVELILYVALALSAAAIAIDVLPEWKRLPWRRIATRHAGVIVFGLVLLLSALRAPLARADAMKFALRSLGGIALYVAAANLLRTPRAALTTAIAMSIGAVVAACLMWAELHLPGAAAALAPFHVQSFDVFDLPRASGPFQYPNIAAMYLEAALPVVLATGAAFDAHRARGFRIGTLVAVLGGVAIVQALSLTASRASLLTALVVVAAVGLNAFWRKTRARWQAPAVLAIFALLAVTNTALGSLVGLRMKFWNDDAWYRSTITPVAAVPGDLAPASRTAFDVDVRNRGVRPWPATGEKHVALSYHWFDAATGALLVYDGVRTLLPDDVAPGATVRLHATVMAPQRPGRLRLHLELVHENATWFGEQGDAGFDAAVLVGDQATADTTPVVAITAPPPMQAPLERAPRRMLWTAALMAWREHPLLGLGPDNFRRAYNRYLGLSRPDERLHANNLYFETLAGLGIAGIGALVLLVVGFAGAARTAIRHHGAASVAGLIATGAAIGLAAYLVHGFFDYFLEFTPTYGLLWLLAGIVTGLAARDTAKAIE
jgi:hypothetical protein